MTPAETGRVLHVMRMTGVGGAENHLRILMPALAANGWRSELLIPTPRPEAVRTLASELATVCDRVSVIRMPFDLSPRLVATLVGRMRSGRYDLVHSHLIHADWHVATASLAAPRVPLVASKHNDDSFRRLRPVQMVETATQRRYREIISISHALREFTLEYTPPRCPLTTVHYGLEAPANGGPHGSRTDRPTALTVTRLVRQKGLDVLIDAWPRVLDRVPDARLLIAGEGIERPALERQIREAGLESSIELLGHRDDVPELMRSSWVMVHPSRWEGFGLVFLEAMSQGLPVVASGVSAIPEVVADGVSGSIVPPEDPIALADAVATLLQDDDCREAYAAAGLERLRSRFSPNRMARETVGIYNRALTGAGVPVPS